MCAFNRKSVLDFITKHLKNTAKRNERKPASSQSTR